MILPRLFAIYTAGYITGLTIHPSIGGWLFLAIMFGALVLYVWGMKALDMHRAQLDRITLLVYQNERLRFKLGEKNDPGVLRIEV